MPCPNAMGTHAMTGVAECRRVLGIELDDDLVARLDELAAQLGTNRSELLRRGATAVITAEEFATTDRELIAGYQRQPPEPALVQSEC